jgi:hypothetical protein
VSNRRLYGAITSAVAVSVAVLSFAVSSQAKADSSAASHNVTVSSVGTDSVGLSWRGVGPDVGNEVLVYDASTLKKVVHTGLEAGDSSGRTVSLGAGWSGKALAVKVAFSVDGINTGWSAPVLFYTTVTGGTAGPKGDTGAAGPQGPSGVVASAVKTLTDAPVLVHTGGSFTSQEQLAGSFDLAKGTYLVSLSAKVAWASGNGVFPQFFAYNGTPAADFSNDIANIGNGSLAQGNATIDSYYDGTFQVTVDADTTVNVYAFGYDTDRGAGTYTLEDLTSTVTQLQLAS